MFIYRLLIEFISLIKKRPFFAAPLGNPYLVIII